MCSRTVLSIPATTGNIIPALTTFTYVSGTTSVSCYLLFLLSVFRSLSAVLRTSLLSVGYACGIKSTSDDVVSGTRKVLNTTTTDQNNGRSDRPRDPWRFCSLGCEPCVENDESALIDDRRE